MNNNKYFTFEKLNGFDNLTHFFTKKPFNFNENLVNEKDIGNNYKVIFSDFNYESKIKKCIQRHTSNIKIVTNDNLNDEFINIDGIITNLTDIALVTYVADCQAILLYDPINKVIGNIHSGWKGTLNKIVLNAINIMIDNFNCNPSNIIACICPSILDCCFEVDEDVMLMFRDIFNDATRYISLGEIKENRQKYYIDTVSINVDILKELGLKDDNIVCSNVCTKCNSSIYHSYRAEGDKSGRNIAFIGLKSNY